MPPAGSVFTSPGVRTSRWFFPIGFVVAAGGRRRGNRPEDLVDAAGTVGTQNWGIRVNGFFNGILLGGCELPAKRRVRRQVTWHGH